MRQENIKQGGPELEIEFEDEDSFWLTIRPNPDSKPIRIRLDIRILPGEMA